MMRGGRKGHDKQGASSGRAGASSGCAGASGGGGGGGAQHFDCVRACFACWCVCAVGFDGGWFGGVFFVDVDVRLALAWRRARRPVVGGGGAAWAAWAAGTSRRVWVGAWHAVRLRRRGRFVCSSASVGGGRVASTTWRGGGGVQHWQGVRRVAWEGVGSAVVGFRSGLRAGGRAGRARMVGGVAFALCALGWVVVEGGGRRLILARRVASRVAALGRARSDRRVVWVSPGGRGGGPR